MLFRLAERTPGVIERHADSSELIALHGGTLPAKATTYIGHYVHVGGVTDGLRATTKEAVEYLSNVARTTVALLARRLDDFDVASPFFRAGGVKRCAASRRKTCARTGARRACVRHCEPSDGTPNQPPLRAIGSLLTLLRGVMAAPLLMSSVCGCGSDERRLVGPSVTVVARPCKDITVRAEVPDAFSDEQAVQMLEGAGPITLKAPSVDGCREQTYEVGDAVVREKRRVTFRLSPAQLRPGSSLARVAYGGVPFTIVHEPGFVWTAAIRGQGAFRIACSLACGSER